MITEKSDGDLAAVWPDVARRVECFLMRRGISAASAEDAVQETAIRAWARRVPFGDANDLYRWASVVALRVAIDDHRRRAPVSGGPVPEQAAPADTAREALARIQWGKVAAALAELSPADHDAIVGVPVPVSRLEQLRLATRRHRARTRLRELAERMVFVLPVYWLCDHDSAAWTVVAAWGWSGWLPLVGRATGVRP